MGQPLASGPVADLIVVLSRDHETPAGQTDGRAAMHATPVRRDLSGVDIAVAQRTGELLDAPEVFVVAGPLPRQHAVERVMKIVRPLRIDPESAGLARADQP